MKISSGSLVCGCVLHFKLERKLRVYRKAPVFLCTLVAAMLGACSTVGPPVLERAVPSYYDTNALLP